MSLTPAAAKQNMMADRAVLREIKHTFWPYTRNSCVCVCKNKWVQAPVLCVVGCNESRCHFRRCCLWVSGSTLEATSECRELRKECQLHLTEYDRRKMMRFGPGMGVPCFGYAHTHIHRHTPTRTFTNTHTRHAENSHTVCHGKVGTSMREQFDLFHQT